VETRGMATADEHHAENQQNHNGHDDPSHLHPPWHATGVGLESE
jgi:hypothetical protein